MTDPSLIWALALLALGGENFNSFVFAYNLDCSQGATFPGVGTRGEAPAAWTRGRGPGVETMLCPSP